MALEGTLAQQDHRLELEVAAFLLLLERMLRRAETTVIARILVRLTTEGGKIVNSVDNRSVLRTTDKLLKAELGELGLNDLVDAFVARFPQEQLSAFTKVLADTVGATDLKTTLNFSSADKRNLTMLQADTAKQLEEVISQGVVQARYNALASVGGTDVRTLAANISSALDHVPTIIKATSGNAISTFYRTIADLGYKNLEQEGPVDFKYVGPPSGDSVIRPFCRTIIRMTEQGHVFTRAEISSLDNGQAQWGMGNVMLHGGGFNCRHQWVVASAKVASASGA